MTRNLEPEDYNFIPYNEILHTTVKAVLFSTPRGNLWLPKTRITINETDKEVQVPDWITLEYK